MPLFHLLKKLDQCSPLNFTEGRGWHKQLSLEIQPSYSAVHSPQAIPTFLWCHLLQAFPRIKPFKTLLGTSRSPGSVSAPLPEFILWVTVTPPNLPILPGDELRLLVPSGCAGALGSSTNPLLGSPSWQQHTAAGWGAAASTDKMLLLPGTTKPD